MTEPGELPFDELPRPRLHALHRLREVCLAVQVIADLAVAQRLRGLPAPRPFQPAQSPDLIDEAGGEHLLDSTIDALRQFVARQIEPEYRRLRVSGRRRPLGLPGAERPTRHLANFQSAADAPQI